MSKVYIIGKDDSRVPMNRVHCKDEYKELQDLLNRNLMTSFRVIRSVLMIPAVGVPPVEGVLAN